VIVLAIETATELVGAAVADEHGTRAAVWATGRRRHAETLAPALAAVLELAGASLHQVTAVAVDVGPGLFTGLRVGVATAKALAQGTGVGLVGVPSLEVLAHAAFEGGWPGTVVAVVDARRGEVFAAFYDRPGAEDASAATGAGGEGPRPALPPRRYRPDELAAELAARGGRPLLAVGDGARRHRALLAGVEGVTVAGPALGEPPPASLAVLATCRLAGGEAAVAPAAVEPLYLRDADVRIGWARRDDGGGTGPGAG